MKSSWIENNPFKMGIISAVATSLLGALVFAIISSNSIKPNWNAYWFVVVPVICAFFLIFGFTMQKLNDRSN